MSNTRVELSSEVRALLNASGAPVVVAVSGGSDSVALALLLNDAFKAGAIPPLHLAHLNHRIRGDEAARDALFVRELARSLGLPVTVGECDVPAAARERRISLEFAARECRYEFLERVARETGAQWVALGHTADDQVETVFHNILRGALIHGLAGMPSVRPIAPGSSVRIIRPLLDIPRRALMDFLGSRAQPWRTDHTNLDTTYTRNRIRHDLIPALAETWPDLREDLIDFTRELSTLDALLQALASEWLRAHGRLAPFEIPLADLQSISEPLKSYVIRAAIASVLGDLRRIDEVHVRMIAELASSGSTGSSLDLPRGLLVRRDYDAVRFALREPESLFASSSNPKSKIQNPKSLPEAPPAWQEPSSLQPMPLPVPGSVRWGRWVIEAEVIEGAQVWEEFARLRGEAGHQPIDDVAQPPPIPIGMPPVPHEEPPADSRERMCAFIALLRKLDPEGVEYLDLERVGEGPLVVRSRVPGDRFTPLGSPGQTKLKDYFIRRKVPHADRDALPLVVSGSRVLVVATLGVDDASSLTPDTTRILKLACTRP